MNLITNTICFPVSLTSSAVAFPSRVSPPLRLPACDAQSVLRGFNVPMDGMGMAHDLA